MSYPHIECWRYFAKWFIIYMKWEKVGNPSSRAKSLRDKIILEKFYANRRIHTHNR